MILSGKDQPSRGGLAALIQNPGMALLLTAIIAAATALAFFVEPLVGWLITAMLAAVIALRLIRYLRWRRKTRSSSPSSPASAGLEPPSTGEDPPAS